MPSAFPNHMVICLGNKKYEYGVENAFAYPEYVKERVSL